MSITPIMLSIFLHFVLLGGLGFSLKNGIQNNSDGNGSISGKDGQKFDPKKPVKVSIIVKKKKSEIVVDSKEGKGDKEKKRQELVNGMICDKSYGGIGVYHEGNVITGVVEGYIASALGIKPGDELVNPTPEDIRGEPNSKITLIVKRNGKFITFHTHREKICEQGTIPPGSFNDYP